MRLLDEIVKQIDGEEAASPFAVRIFLTAGAGGYFQNVDSIFSFSGKEVVLLCPEERLTIAGERLVIRKYCEKDVLIGGEILTITRERKLPRKPLLNLSGKEGGEGK